jgi:hypothetical protein
MNGYVQCLSNRLDCIAANLLVLVSQRWQENSRHGKQDPGHCQYLSSTKKYQKHLRQCNAKAPDGLGFEAVALVETSPVLQCQARTILVDIVENVHQWVTGGCRARKVAVEVADRLSDNKGDNYPSNEHHKVQACHDPESNICMRHVKWNCDENVESYNGSNGNRANNFRAGCKIVHHHLVDKVAGETENDHYGNELGNADSEKGEREGMSAIARNLHFECFAWKLMF